MISVAYAALWVFVFAVPWERLIVLTGVSIITRVTGALALGLALAVVVTGPSRLTRVCRWVRTAVATSTPTTCRSNN